MGRNVTTHDASSDRTRLKCGDPHLNISSTSALYTMSEPGTDAFLMVEVPCVRNRILLANSGSLLWYDWVRLEGSFPNRQIVYYHLAFTSRTTSRCAFGESLSVWFR